MWMIGSEHGAIWPYEAIHFSKIDGMKRVGWQFSISISTWDGPTRKLKKAAQIQTWLITRRFAVTENLLCSSNDPLISKTIEVLLG